MSKILYFFKSVLLGTLIVVCLCSCSKDTSEYLDEEEIISEGETESKEHTETELDGDENDNEIFVYVCGEIQKPGVYRLPAGSRVCDAFVIAGGFTENAATDYWNQASILKDGEMIYVPTKEEGKERQFNTHSAGQTETSDRNKVNINTASKEELMTLPGIGASKAESILSYRKEHGPFSSIEDLKKVEGIKNAVLSKVKNYIEI